MKTDHNPVRDRKTTQTRRAIFAGGIALTGMAMIAGFGHRTDDTAAPAGAASRHPASGFESTAAATHKWNWAADGRASYAFEWSGNLQVSGSKPSPDPIFGLKEITGRFHVCVVESDAQSVTLAMQLSDSIFTEKRDGDEGPHREPVYEEMLNSTAGLVRLSRDGKLLSIKLPATLADDDRWLFNGLFDNQFVLGQGDTWETDEALLGSVTTRARYVAESATKFHKSRQLFFPKEERPASRITSSSFTATLGSFWIETLEGSESDETTIGDGAKATAERSVKLRRLPDTTIPQNLLTLAADPAARAGFLGSDELASRTVATDKPAAERQHLAQLIERYGAVPAAKMISDLSTAVANAKEEDDVKEAAFALRDWLLANQGRASEIEAALKDPALTNAVTTYMAEALKDASRRMMW